MAAKAVNVVKQTQGRGGRFLRVGDVATSGTGGRKIARLPVVAGLFIRIRRL